MACHKKNHGVTIWLIEYIIRFSIEKQPNLRRLNENGYADQYILGVGSRDNSSLSPVFDLHPYDF